MRGNGRCSSSVSLISARLDRGRQRRLSPWRRTPPPPPPHAVFSYGLVLVFFNRAESVASQTWSLLAFFTLACRVVNASEIESALWTGGAAGLWWVEMHSSAKRTFRFRIRIHCCCGRLEFLKQSVKRFRHFFSWSCPIVHMSARPVVFVSCLPRFFLSSFLSFLAAKWVCGRCARTGAAGQK